MIKLFILNLYITLLHDKFGFHCENIKGSKLKKNSDFLHCIIEI